MAIEKELLDRLLADRDPEDVFAKDGLLDDLKKALSERILNAELEEHLDVEEGSQAGNRRNGSSQKTVLTDTSKIVLDIPRDRPITSGRGPHRMLLPCLCNTLISMTSSPVSTAPSSLREHPTAGPVLLRRPGPVLHRR